MTDKFKIVEEYAEWIKKFCYSLSNDKMLMDDLAQEIYLILLNYKDETIIAAHGRAELKFLIIRIIKNQFNSKTSAFYKVYRKGSFDSLVDELVNLDGEYENKLPKGYNNEDLWESIY